MQFAPITLLAAPPGWLQAPHWLWPVTHAMGHVLRGQPGLGLLLVIFAEELGIPLPAPGDAAITFAGYLTTGGLAFPLAFLAVVAGATLGSFCLFMLSRRYGHRFLVRFGPYGGITPERLASAERAFQRWGPWAVIIGRHVPGMRVVLSAFAGAFGMRARVFVPCVILSSSLWALIFLEVGRTLGRNSRLLFRVFPAHLLPVGLLVVILVWVVWFGHEQRSRRRNVRSRSARDSDGSSGQPPKAEGRTAKM